MYNLAKLLEHKKEYLEAKNTYTKGPLFCVYTNDEVHKYPLNTIWRIVEDFGPKTTSK